MVSAQLPNTEIDLGYTTPNGNWVSVIKPGLAAITGSGGSSEGAIATAFAQNTAWRLPLILKPAYPGCALNVRFRLIAASAVDKSDGVMVLPVTIKDLRTGEKTVKILNNLSFGTATDVVSGDFGVWMLYGATGYVVPSGEEICWGSAPSIASFLSIEDGA